MLGFEFDNLSLEKSFEHNSAPSSVWIIFIKFYVDPKLFINDSEITKITGLFIAISSVHNKISHIK